MTQYWGPCRITVMDSVSWHMSKKAKAPGEEAQCQVQVLPTGEQRWQSCPQKGRGREGCPDGLAAAVLQANDWMGHDGTWWDMMGHGGHGAPLGTWENSGFNLPNRQIYSKSDHLGQSSLVERSTVARQHTISSNCFCPSTWFAEVCELLCH